MKTTALTAYGMVGTEWIRLTAVILETGAYAFRRADGTNVVISELPTRYRTGGDIANVAASAGHKVNMASISKSSIGKHAWKGEFDLEGIATHMAGKAGPTIALGLVATYVESELIAA